VWAVLTLPIAALGLWAFWLEPASVGVRTHHVTLPSWPEACGVLRVAVLADVHVGSPFNGLDKLDKVVALTNQSRPDLILMTGDYVITGVKGGSLIAPEAFAPALRRLRANMGVYAVLGNHDYWFDAPRVRQAFEGAGIPVLRDRARRVERGSCAFWIAGLTDFWEDHHDLPGALSEVPAMTRARRR